MPVARLLKSLNSKDVKREVEDELQFHLELAAQAHIQQGMSSEIAKSAALKRFGDVERIKNQCVEISRRSHPLMRAVKSFLILVFLTGVFVRVFSADIYVMQSGTMLIAVAVLSRLLLYARGLSPSSFLSKDETSSPLMLNAGSQTLIAVYNESVRTPIERVISDK
jgi:hypothetical protein